MLLIFSDKFEFPFGKIGQRPDEQWRFQQSCPTQEASLEHVKVATCQVFDADEDTRQRMTLSSMKWVSLPEHEGRAHLVDCTLISRFSVGGQPCQIILKIPILRTDGPSSQHTHKASISNSFKAMSEYIDRTG